MIMEITGPGVVWKEPIVIIPLNCHAIQVHSKHVCLHPQICVALSFGQRKLFVCLFICLGVCLFVFAVGNS